ncbi:MAG TPA: hypothetical protein VH595_16420 [Verrucomicrobiae bacterium]|jgi:tetratricopeptide (TPR) repeat protein|nr:hypothetical protein [Verrucomicrobiae bacterium]
MARQHAGEHADDLAQALCELAWAFEAEGKLAEAENASRQALTLREKLKPQRDGLNLIDTLYEVTVILKEEQKLDEAELFAKRCQACCDRQIPNDWRTFNCRSTLGCTLVAAQKYAEAEPLLLSAYGGLTELKPAFFIDTKPRVEETVEGLVAVYDHLRMSDKAADWKLKLDALEGTR